MAGEGWTCVYLDSVTATVAGAEIPVAANITTGVTQYHVEVTNQNGSSVLVYYIDPGKTVGTNGTPIAADSSKSTPFGPMDIKDVSTNGNPKLHIASGTQACSVRIYQRTI